MRNRNLRSVVNLKWALKGTSVKQGGLREDLRVLLITCHNSPSLFVTKGSNSGTLKSLRASTANFPAIT